MHTLPLFAFRTSLLFILGAVVVGLILGGIVRVIMDAVRWYRDHMIDPYRDLRKSAQAARKPRKTLEEIVNEDRTSRGESPEEVE